MPIHARLIEDPELGRFAELEHLPFATTTALRVPVDLLPDLREMVARGLRTKAEKWVMHPSKRFYSLATIGLFSLTIMKDQEGRAVLALVGGGTACSTPWAEATGLFAALADIEGEAMRRGWLRPPPAGALN